MDGDGAVKDRTTQGIVCLYILKFLEAGGRWTVERIIREIDKVHSFSGEDIRRSKERPNEVIWHQIVRNALASSRANSLTKRGYVYSPRRGEYQITQEGRQHLELAAIVKNA